MRLAVLMSAKANYNETQIVAACRIANALDLPLAGIATSEDTLQYYTVGAGTYAATASQSVALVENRLESFATQFKQTCAEAEVARAVRVATPLIQRFATVNVLIIDPPSRTQPHDIGSYLGSHDISANILREPSSGSSVSTLILEAANEADLVIMGAYGVSITLERLFGGVTERLRRACKTPVIYAN